MTGHLMEPSGFSSPNDATMDGSARSVDSVLPQETLFSSNVNRQLNWGAQRVNRQLN